MIESEPNEAFRACDFVNRSSAAFHVECEAIDVQAACAPSRYSALVLSRSNGICQDGLPMLINACFQLEVTGTVEHYNFTKHGFWSAPLSEARGGAIITSMDITTLPEVGLRLFIPRRLPKYCS
jgi:hypothetical protein